VIVLFFAVSLTFLGFVSSRDIFNLGRRRPFILVPCSGILVLMTVGG
jgi:hypothetical protein